MVPLAYVYDPTGTDEQSKYRGVGRYLQILRENFHENTEESMTSATHIQTGTLTFVNDLKSVPKNGIFINPFFNIYQKPLKLGRVASKQIAVIHDLIPLKYKTHFPVGFKGWFYSLLNKWTLHNYDLIVTDSEVSKKDIMVYLKIPETRIKVIYPTVSHLFLPHLDTNTESVEHHHPFHTTADHSEAEFSSIPDQKMSSNPQLAPLKNFIVYVGDATWNKNLPVLAQAVQLANIPCVFVGKVFGEQNVTKMSTKPHPWQKSLYTFLKMAQNNKLFIFPGFISDVELLTLYKKAKFNILPSIDEGFGFSYVEAGYVGTPSVLSDSPIFHETAKDAAIFAKATDPKEMAQKMVELYYDNLKLEKMSIKTFDRAQEYAPERFKSRWVEVIASLS